MTEKSPGERYAVVADVFGARVRAVDTRDWERPTPCDGWVARDVVRHLVAWVPGFMQANAGLEPPELPDADDDPVGAWQGLDDRLRTWLADPAVAGLVTDWPMGPLSVGEAVDRFVTPDVLVHTWDLARATGLDDHLDEAAVGAMAEAMEPFDAQLRDSGHFGPRVAVGDGASAQDRLLAFLGRDPAWSAPPR